MSEVKSSTIEVTIKLNYSRNFSPAEEEAEFSSPPWSAVPRLPFEQSQWIQYRTRWIYIALDTVLPLAKRYSETPAMSTKVQSSIC